MSFVRLDSGDSNKKSSFFKQIRASEWISLAVTVLIWLVASVSIVLFGELPEKKEPAYVSVQIRLDVPDVQTSPDSSDEMMTESAVSEETVTDNAEKPAIVSEKPSAAEKPAPAAEAAASKPESPAQKPAAPVQEKVISEVPEVSAPSASANTSPVVTAVEPAAESKPSPQNVAEVSGFVTTETAVAETVSETPAVVTQSVVPAAAETVPAEAVTVPEPVAETEPVPAAEQIVSVPEQPAPETLPAVEKPAETVAKDEVKEAAVKNEVVSKEDVVAKDDIAAETDKAVTNEEPVQTLETVQTLPAEPEKVDNPEESVSAPKEVPAVVEPEKPAANEEPAVTSQTPVVTEEPKKQEQLSEEEMWALLFENESFGNTATSGSGNGQKTPNQQSQGSSLGGNAGNSSTDPATANASAESKPEQTNPSSSDIKARAENLINQATQPNDKTGNSDQNRIIGNDGLILQVGNNRGLIKPTSPKIEIPQELHGGVEATVTITINFTVNDSGNVVPSSVKLSSEVGLSQNVVSFIRNEITKWIFDPSKDGSSAEGSLKFTIVK